MATRKLYSPSGTMRVAGLMSGEGTNLQKIIEQELELKRHYSYPYHVAVIFTDNAKSNAVQLGTQYDIPVVVHDIKSFYKNKNLCQKNLEVRKEYDAETANIFRSFSITVLAYSGYMSIATTSLTKSFLGINVHPSDLTIKNDDGTKKYVGKNAVRDAILSGEKYLRSTTHLVEDKADYGRIMMLSEPIEVLLPNDFDKNNPNSVDLAEKINKLRLKEFGDWKIFPKTILDIAKGKYSIDDVGNIYYEDSILPNGLRLK